MSPFESSPSRASFRELVTDRRRRHLADFLAQGAAMLRAGLPMAQAIEHASSALPDGVLRDLGPELVDRIHAGQPLADVIEAHSTLFPSPIPVLVRAGEDSGRLEPILDRLSHQLHEAILRRKRFLSRLAYPTLLVHLAIFVRHLTQLGQGNAAFLWGVSRDYLILYALTAGAVFAFFRLRSDQRWSRRFDGIPLWGTMRVQRSRRDFLEVLSALYGAGVGLRSAYERAVSSLSSVRRPAYEPGAKSLADGRPFAEALEAAGWPEDQLRSIASGEIAGRLEESIDHLRVRLDETVARLADRLAAGLARAIWLLAVLYVVTFIVGFYLDYFAALSAL